MLLACNSLKGGNPLQEKSYLMVRRETSTTGIELLSAISGLEPSENVFDNALMELMQDVGSDRQEDVDVGKLFPERMAHWLDSRLATCTGECGGSVVNLPKRGSDIREITQGVIGFGVVSDVCGRDVALGAGAILATGDKQLFGVVADVHRQDWVSSSRHTVTADNFDAVNASLDKRLEDHGKAGVEEIGVDATACSFVRDMLEARGWEVCEEYLPSSGWLAADVLREVSYR